MVFFGVWANRNWTDVHPPRPPVVCAVFLCFRQGARGQAAASEVLYINQNQFGPNIVKQVPNLASVGGGNKVEDFVFR